MKSSLIIFAGVLASISNATPTPKEVDIHLDIKIEDNTPIAAQNAKHSVEAGHSKDIFVNKDLCLLICLPEAPQCSEGWYAKELGDCWTCCKIPSDDFLVAPEPKKTQYVINAAPSKPSKDLFNFEEICLRACLPESFKCPENWYLKQFSDECWSCCKNFGDDDLIAPQPKKAQYVMNAAPSKPSKDLFVKYDDPCWRVCFPQSVTCPDKWYSKQFGNCWTCCLKADDDLITTEL